MQSFNRQNNEDTKFQPSLSLLMIGAGVAIALLVVNLTLAFHNIRRLRDEANRVQHTHQVLRSLRTIISLAKEGESGVRGYAITGQPTYLDAHRAALADINDQAETVARLTLDNPQQQAKIPALQQRISAKLAIMNQIITTRRTEGFNAASQLILEGKSQETMMVLRALVAEMTQVEQDLLVERSQQHRQTYLTALVAGGLCGGAGLVAIIAFIVLLRQYLTSHMQATVTITQQTERLRTTLASIGDAVITTDTEGQITSMNAVAEGLTGWQHREAMGQPLEVVFRIVHDETRQPVENPALRALATGVIIGLTNHTVLITKDGIERPIDDSAAPIRYQEGKIGGCVLVFRDVTERRQSEEQLQHSEERFRALVDATTSIVWTTNAAGAFVTPQPSWSKYTGQTWEELQGFGWVNALHSEDRARIQSVWEDARNQLRLYQSEGRLWHAPSQSYRFFEAKGIPICEPDGTLREWVGMCVDVNDRQQARVLLNSRVQQQEAVAQLSQQALGDRHLNVLFDQATQLVAKKLGVEYCKILQCLPNSQELLLRAGVGWHQGLVGKATVSNSTQSQAGYTLTSKAPVVVQDLRKETRFSGPSLLVEHQVVSGMSVVISSGDHTFGVLGAHTQQKRSFTQEDINFLQVVANILGMAIKRHETEVAVQTLNDTLERRVHDRTLQLEELNQELKDFTYTVSHDLRAPLRSLQGFATALLEDYTDELDALGLEYARRLMTSAQQMEQLIQDLLTYSRLSQKNIKFKAIDLKDVISQALVQHDLKISKRHAQITIASELPQVFGNPTILLQVISNLIDNALKFVPAAQQPVISLWTESKGNRVRLWIEDNGLGIDPDHQERIFEVFERLHGIEAYPGTGIGLAIVRKGMTQMGGNAGVESSLGQGSRFWIEIPQKSSSSFVRN